jgi:hypothetical protein
MTLIASRSFIGAVALRHFFKADDAIKDAARLDPFLKDIRQKLLDVGADRGRAAAR